MPAATKSWREKLKCYFLHSRSPRLRQTQPARGRLIAGEIEFESQFLLWIRHSRLVFKMMCRCFQIWQEKGWKETRHILFVCVCVCTFCPPTPPSLCETTEEKTSILYEFHGPVPLFRKRQLTGELRGLRAVRSQISQSEVFTSSLRLLLSSSGPSTLTRADSGLPNARRRLRKVSRPLHEAY